jgi:hypothetical protein
MLPRGKDGAINNLLMYLCGWSFKTILKKCGIKVLENGEPVIG